MVGFDQNNENAALTNIRKVPEGLIMAKKRFPPKANVGNWQAS
jgi:hypothetical protein